MAQAIHQGALRSLPEERSAGWGNAVSTCRSIHCGGASGREAGSAGRRGTHRQERRQHQAGLRAERFQAVVFETRQGTFRPAIHRHRRRILHDRTGGGTNGGSRPQFHLGLQGRETRARVVLSERTTRPPLEKGGLGDDVSVENRRASERVRRQESARDGRRANRNQNSRQRNRPVDMGVGDRFGGDFGRRCTTARAAGSSSLGDQERNLQNVEVAGRLSRRTQLRTR